MWAGCFVFLLQTEAADQSKPGPGNAQAARIAEQSPLVQSAWQYLREQAGRVRDTKLRQETVDAISNPNACVAHRAGLNAEGEKTILQHLLELGVVDSGDAAAFPNGLQAGVFPRLMDQGTACPKLPQPIYSAPGSSFGGHHSYPGGLMLHEAFNEMSGLNFAHGYRRVYGGSRADGLPVLGSADGKFSDDASDVFISQDVVTAAPIWHDWAKALVFQWNGDGTEFQELNFGGAGSLKTGAHHILGIAEAIARGLSPEFVIALASAHSTNEERVAAWIRAAAVIARVDPVARGFLQRDSAHRLRPAAVRQLGADSNMLIEIVIHNLSDSDFTLTGPALSDVETMLAAIAPQFGFDAKRPSDYNNRFRNVVLSNFSAERLLMIYGNSGVDGVTAEISKLHTLRR